MSDPAPIEVLKLATRFRVPDFMRGSVAHHLMIQPLEDEIALTFFELKPPLISGDPEERDKQIELVKQMGYVDADCVARIIISKARFHLFAKTMNDFLQVIGEEPQSGE